MRTPTPAISKENNVMAIDDMPTDLTSLLESPNFVGSPSNVQSPTFLPNLQTQPTPSSFSAPPRSPPEFRNLANQAYFAITVSLAPPTPNPEPVASPYQSPSCYLTPENTDFSSWSHQTYVPNALSNLPRLGPKCSSDEPTCYHGSTEQPLVAEPRPPTPTSDSPLASRLAYVLRAVVDAGFESLENVVSTLYTTDFTEETADERICRAHSDSRWEARIETMIGAIEKHSPTKIAHKPQLP